VPPKPSANSTSPSPRLADVAAMFEHADPADEAALYADLGLTLT
jgi:hypothetical protein